LKSIQKTRNGALQQTLSYGYDGVGQRVKVTDSSGTHYFLYDGGMPALELDANQNITDRYLYGANGVVYRYLVGTEQYEYHHTNALGSVIVVTDDNQGVLARYAYGAFGSIYDQMGASGSPRRFTGKEFDGDVKLYYYGARYYDPYLGRFTTRDPAGQGLNWYVYANNNPLKFVDPDGRFFTLTDIARAIENFLKRMGLRPLEPGDLVVGPTGGGLIVGGESGPALMDPEDPGEIVKAAQEAAIESVVEDLVTSESESGSRLSGSGLRIHGGRQGKHIPGHPNFDKNAGRSELTHPDPQALIDRGAGTGVRNGQREWVDFGETIGIHVDKNGNRTPTTRGTIHYGKDGYAHLVPALPKPPKP
jgi:RHS repeat-associated protein